MPDPAIIRPVRAGIMADRIKSFFATLNSFPNGMSETATASGYQTQQKRRPGGFRDARVSWQYNCISDGRR